MSDEARTPKVVVVMPAYNAGRTLRMTYEELPKDTVSMVILVDDGSTDTTLEIARQLGLEIFVHNRNYGYGANQKTCYAEALRAGADIIVMVHPDYQYDPRLVPQIIAPLLRGEADVVLGSRLKSGSALQQSPRQVHPAAVTGAPRPLDAVAAGLVLLTVAVIATGGFTVRGLPVNRAEDVLVLATAVVALRALLAPIALPRVRPARAVTAGVGAYALLMGFLVATRHAALQTPALDLGYYVQVVWSIAHGHGAYVTLPSMHAWGDHFSPVLYLLVPLGRLVPGGTVLVLAQTVVLCSGAVAVFVYAARRLHSVSDAARPAAALALLYLANPSLHGINIRDIHPQAFAVAFLVWAAAAFDAQRYGWCVLALVLTLGGREDAAIAVVGFGLWLALARRRWALGAAVVAVSVLVLLVDLTWVMPYFRGSPYPHLDRYRHLGASVPEILVTLVARPWRWAPIVLTLPKLAYLAAMLAPLGFLPLLAPRSLAAAVPGRAMNLLSFDPVLFNYRSQYQSFVLPFFVLASVDGYARLRQWRACEARGGGGVRASVVPSGGPRPVPW